MSVSVAALAPSRETYRRLGIYINVQEKTCFLKQLLKVKATLSVMRLLLQKSVLHPVIPPPIAFTPFFK